MVGQEVKSTNVRDSGSGQTGRHVPGMQRCLPCVEGAYRRSEGIGWALEPERSEFRSPLCH